MWDLLPGRLPALDHELWEGKAVCDYLGEDSPALVPTKPTWGAFKAMQALSPPPEGWLNSARLCPRNEPISF